MKKKKTAEGDTSKISAQVSASGRIPKVLIVEDSKAISKALSLKLSEEPIEVITASSGKDAISHISKGSFDVILLDLVIPDINGFSILEALRTKKSKKEYFIKSDTPISSVVEYTKDCLKNAD
jgi:CheY-like chemotaxis protein